MPPDEALERDWASAAEEGWAVADDRMVGVGLELGDAEGRSELAGLGARLPGVVTATGGADGAAFERRTPRLGRRVEGTAVEPTIRLVGRAEEVEPETKNVVTVGTSVGKLEGVAGSRPQ